MNFDYIIILIVIIIILLGLPLIFLFIIMRRIYRRFTSLENKIQKMTEDLNRNQGDE